MRKTSLICILFFIMASCSNSLSKMETVFNEAGENRNELEIVLDFYSKKPHDSLKHKAAVFLIENMSRHSSCQKLDTYKAFFDSIGKYPNKNALDYKNRLDYFRKCLDSAKNNNNIAVQKQPIGDSQMVSSKHLISTIELVFDAWYKIPENKRARFDDFCNYILPYKTANEPIEENSRLELSRKYAWVLKDLNSGIPLKTVVDSVKVRLNYHFLTDIGEFYPQPLSISQVEKTRFGFCSDGVNYLVQVFRSLGLVSAKDQINCWGNKLNGHSWLYVKYGNEECKTDVGSIGDKLTENYKKESIPKIMRESYYANNEDVFFYNLKDVTAHYVKTASIKVKNRFGAPEIQAVLCVFDRENEWKPVCSGQIKESSFCYENMGCNVLYMAANLTNGKVTPINYPFFIKKNGSIGYYEPHPSQKNRAILTRKMFINSPRQIFKKRWLTNLKGCVFQGANNPNFDHATDLYTLGNVTSTHPQTIHLQIKEKFKYLRFYSKTEKNYIAKLAFFDENHAQLTGDIVIKNNTENSENDKVFDLKKTLQYAGGLEHFEIGLQLNKRYKITAITWQPRNENNHINVGETYELLYWDKKWKSLGTQVAKDTLLRYSTPKNALLWLKNLTVGKEEHIFVVDKNNRQYWPGVDNY